jgi:rRNA maturation RNase YbeY
LNKKYLKHDTLTDIITFPLGEDQGSICGDIFISIDRVKDNAKKYNQRTQQEIRRVIIHGILHLIGYKDKSKKESELMRDKEEFYLSELIEK